MIWPEKRKPRRKRQEPKTDHPSVDWSCWRADELVRILPLELLGAVDHLVRVDNQVDMPGDLVVVPKNPGGIIGGELCPVLSVQWGTRLQTQKIEGILRDTISISLRFKYNYRHLHSSEKIICKGVN